MNGSATRPSMAPPRWTITPPPACLRSPGRNAWVTKMGPFTLTASNVYIGRRVVLNGLARRDAREVHHRIDPAEVLEGCRRQLL